MLKKQVDSLEEVQESFRKFYKKNEEDGKFHLTDPSLIELVDRSSNLDEFKATTQKLNKELESLKSQISTNPQKTVSSPTPSAPIPKRTVSMPVNNTANQIDEELEALKKGLKVPSNVKDLISKQKDALDAVLQENKRLREERKQDLIRRQITSAISKHKGNSVLLEPFVLNKIQTVETDDGRLELRIINSSGEHEMNDKGSFKSVEEFIGELKKDKQFAGCFESESVSGAGIKKDSVLKSSSSSVGNVSFNPNVLLNNKTPQKDMMNKIDEYKQIPEESLKKNFKVV